MLNCRGVINWCHSKSNCGSHPKSQLMSLWVSINLDKGAKVSKILISSQCCKKICEGKKVLWHMFTRCVALAIKCSKWWNPISFQLMFDLLIPPKSLSFVTRVLCPLFIWCTSSETLALLWLLSDVSVFKIWTFHKEKTWSTEWEIQVFYMWYDAQSLHIVF